MKKIDRKIMQFKDLVKYYEQKVEFREKEVDVLKDGKSVKDLNRFRTQLEEYRQLLEYLLMLKSYEETMQELILASANKDTAEIFNLNYTIKFIRNRVKEIE